MNLTPNQAHYARLIVAVVHSLGYPVRAAHLALETALTESGLRMYANGNNPDSLKLPHDAIGWDHGSVGLFQQQVGGAVNATSNWGTTGQLMDASTSTQLFLARLSQFPGGWMGVAHTNWELCQWVQGSSFADGSNYRANDAAAIALGNQLWAELTAAAPAPPHPVATPVPVPHGYANYTVQPGDNLTLIARHYPPASITADSIAAANRDVWAAHGQPFNTNHIEPGWVLRIR